MYIVCIISLFILPLNCSNLTTKCNNNSQGATIQPYSLRKTLTVDGEDFVFRVVNGRRAKPGDVPYQIALMKGVRNNVQKTEYQTFCGAALIKPSKLVTAAHCFERKRLSDCYIGTLKRGDFQRVYAVAGNMRTRDYKPKARADDREEAMDNHGQWRKLVSGSYPKNYIFPRFDVAILHTDRPYIINEFVDTIPYAGQFQDYKRLVCRASGFGRRSETESSPYLQIADLEVTSIERCGKLHRRNMKKFVCTSDLIADVHKGDSGGPLVCKHTIDKNEDPIKGVLVGVVSGKRAHDPMSTFFTRISEYYEFVNSSSKLESNMYLVVIVALINAALLLLYRVLFIYFLPKTAWQNLK